MLARYCMLWTVLAAALIAVLPWALTRLAEKAALLGRLGPVFLCYAAGVLGSFFFRAVRADMSVVTTLYSVFVMLTIPLILFSADLGAVRRLADGSEVLRGESWITNAYENLAFVTLGTIPHFTYLLPDPADTVLEIEYKEACL